MGILTADELEGGDGAAASGGDEVLAELERCQAELKVMLVKKRSSTDIIIRYCIIQNYIRLFLYYFDPFMLVIFFSCISAYQCSTIIYSPNLFLSTKNEERSINIVVVCCLSK